MVKHNLSAEKASLTSIKTNHVKLTADDCSTRLVRGCSAHLCIGGVQRFAVFDSDSVLPNWPTVLAAMCSPPKCVHACGKKRNGCEPCWAVSKWERLIVYVWCSFHSIPLQTLLLSACMT